MQFISTAFWLFLPTVLVLYALQGWLRAQNALLLWPVTSSTGGGRALPRADRRLDRHRFRRGRRLP